jgi:hypothetical protein
MTSAFAVITEVVADLHRLEYAIAGWTASLHVLIDVLITLQICNRLTVEVRGGKLGQALDAPHWRPPGL